MGQEPETLPEFIALFPDETAAWRYLVSTRWPDGFVCPKCGDTRATFLAKNSLLQCKNGHQTSATAGTVMHGTRTPLLTWFYGAFLISTLTPSISALQFQRQLGIKRYETAFQMLHKLRAGLVDPERTRLHGEVEVDETYIGGKRIGGKRGRGVEKALVIVAVEIVHYAAPDPYAPNDPNRAVQKTRAGRVRISVIPNAEGETLVPWVQKNIAPGTLVKTDGWSGYNGLRRAGFNHQAVLQSHRGVKTGEYLHMVHLIISNLDRWLLGTFKGAVSQKHLPAYLNEFTFRFNRRFWRGPAFHRALGLGASAPHGWPEYETLYSGAWVHPNPRR